MQVQFTFRFYLMNTIRKTIFIVTACLTLFACSSTTSDVNQVIEGVDRSSIQGVSLVIGGESIQLTSQTSSSIFTLYQNAKEVEHIAELVAQRYGFVTVEEKDMIASFESALNDDEPASPFEGRYGVNEKESVTQGFYMNILAAMPDGGACLEGLSTAAKNLSYTGSVLTFGVAPASAEHCLIVKAELYQYQDGLRVLVGEFSSNLGRVGLYAGANEIDNYKLNVDKADEVRSLEVSFGGLLNTMLSEGAFEQKKAETFEFE